MRHLIVYAAMFPILAMLEMASAHDGHLDASISGTWFNPERNGEGWMIQVVSEDTVVIDWLTYLPGGGGQQTWIYGVGQLDDQRIIVAEAFTVEGLDFSSDVSVENIPLVAWGSYTMAFDSCQTGVIDFAGRGDFGSGTLEVQRLTSISGLGCDSDEPIVEGATLAEQAAPGSWVDPQRLGQGWLLENSGNGLTLMTWFTHRNGRPAWLFGQGFFQDTSLTMLDVVITEGGSFGTDFDPDAVQRLVWGDLQMRFSDCNVGTLQFRSELDDFGTGSFSFERATGIAGLECDPAASAAQAPRIDGQWSNAGMLPTDRTEVAVASMNGSAFVYGGFGDNRRALERFDPVSGVFEVLPDAPVGRDHAMLVGHQGQLYLFGGLGESPELNYMFDPESKQWFVLDSTLPRQFSAGAAISVGSKIFLVGGQPTVALVHDPQSGSFEAIEPPIALGWDHTNAVLFDGEIWMVGGRDFRRVHNAVQILNPVTRSWRTGPSMNDARSGYAIGVHDGQIYVAGGETYSPGALARTVPSVEVYSSATGWQRAPQLPAAVHGTQGAVLNDRFYLFGGSTVGAAVTPDGVGVQVYTP